MNDKHTFFKYANRMVKHFYHYVIVYYVIKIGSKFQNRYFQHQKHQQPIPHRYVRTEVPNVPDIKAVAEMLKYQNSVQKLVVNALQVDADVQVYFYQMEKFIKLKNQLPVWRELMRPQL